MNTSFEKIVDTKFIGKAENPVSMEDIFALACTEKLAPASRDAEKVMLLAVDVQRDFMDGGALGVSGSCDDVARLTRFIYDNITKITSIAATLDTHSLQQIFHACWWRDEHGKAPAPFTVIAKEDIDSGKWRPVFEPEASAEYLEHLECSGQKKLCIWPYHCLEGTTGCALESQFANMAHFFSLARNSKLHKIIKGTMPATEFYGAFRPEYSPGDVFTNKELLDEIAGFDKIIVAGEAMDYCVYETVKQMLEWLSARSKEPEVFILSDCTSSIQPRETAEALYAELAGKYKFNLVKSTENFL